MDTYLDPDQARIETDRQRVRLDVLHAAKQCHTPTMGMGGTVDPNTVLATAAKFLQFVEG